jgi:hypothetical protein
VKPLADLIDLVDPGLPVLHELLVQAKNENALLPCEGTASAACLLALQVSTHSLLGTMAHETGGLLVDAGWLRILGSGCPQLPRGIHTWNQLGTIPIRLPGMLLVADDAVGGFFAVNAGKFTDGLGHVFYLAPDSLEFESLEVGYSGFLEWALNGNLNQFYANAHWPNWRHDVKALRPERAISIYPPLVDQKTPLDKRSRKEVPVDELWALHSAKLVK